MITDELRDALARHDDWGTADTAAEVVYHARRLIQAVDMRAAVIEQMRQVTPTEAALAEILGQGSS